MLLAERLRSEEEKTAMRIVLEEQVLTRYIERLVRVNTVFFRAGSGSEDKALYSTVLASC